MHASMHRTLLFFLFTLMDISNLFMVYIPQSIGLLSRMYMLLHDKFKGVHVTRIQQEIVYIIRTLKLSISSC